MRMWMLEPGCLCNRHLLGEHGELHKHMHCFSKRHRMTGRIFPITLIEPKSIKLRHEALAKEMVLRGMRHCSPLQQPDISYLPEAEQSARVNINVSMSDLYARCNLCRDRIKKA